MDITRIVTSEVIREVKEIVKRHLLNVHDPKEIPVATQLKMGDELCRGKMIPMSSLLIKKVTEIYDNCDPGDNSDATALLTRTMLSNPVSDLIKRRYDHSRDPGNSKSNGTPLMKALDMGLMDMVWGFIECAKQTNSNLLTNEKGDEAVQEFLWLPNRSNGETAFDVAIARNQMEVASQLLNDAPVARLASQLNRRGKTLLLLLNNYDPKYDAIIFDLLEKEKRAQVNPPTSYQIHHDSQQESIVDTESIRNLNSSLQPQPERNKTLEVLKNFDHGLLGLNPSKNSILHLLSKFGDVKYAKEILEKHPSMISCRNSNGETPAYVAASEGHANILQIMFQYMKEKNEDIERILTRNMDKHNALHIAIQNHQVEVIFFLIEEIPQLANHINDFKESPLYVAAERKYCSVLKQMLNKCNEISFAGPNDRTALHAAAISDSAECIKYLLQKRRDLLNVEDEYNWTAFRYAVCNNSSLATTELLNVDNSIGYQLMTEDDINTSAVHIAASRGHYETMKVLMSKCIGCSEFIDSKGRNILHVAVENRKREVIEFIFQEASLTSLINQKDGNGNTPIHMLVASDFEMMEKVMDFRVDLHVLNNEKQTPLDKTSSHNQKERLIKRTVMGLKKNTRSANISKYGGKEKEYGDEEKVETEAKKEEAEARFKVAENLVVVVTLIATASFAAGITLPGGLDSNDGSKQGTPFLLTKAAFKAFMVTNAIAFSCSCAVLLIYIALLLYRNQYIEASLADQEYVNDRIADMYLLTAIALIAMAIAFITGVYVVLTPSHALSISICVMSVVTIWLGVHVSIEK